MVDIKTIILLRFRNEKSIYGLPLRLFCKFVICLCSKSKVMSCNYDDNIHFIKQLLLILRGSIIYNLFTM